MYESAVIALGMISTSKNGLAIDAYVPISDNVRGVAEVKEMSYWIRKSTDALDVAGNTTAAIKKGSAIGLAALVLFPLFDVAFIEFIIPMVWRNLLLLHLLLHL